MEGTALRMVVLRASKGTASSMMLVPPGAGAQSGKLSGMNLWFPVGGAQHAFQRSDSRRERGR